MSDRCHYVYRTHASGISAAVRSFDLIGRSGLLTLDEARQVSAVVPGVWIGRMPSIDEPLEAVFHVDE